MEFERRGSKNGWLATAAANGSRNVSQMHYARQGVITEEMSFVAQRERIEPELVHNAGRDRVQDCGTCR